MVKENDLEFDELLLYLAIAIIAIIELCPWLLNDEEFAAPKKKRCVRTTYQRIPFDEMLKDMRNDDVGMKRLLRMSRPSFDRLVHILEDKIKVDQSYAARRGGAITPHYCVFLTIRYLAGSKYCLLSNSCKASRAAVYSAIERTMIAITECPELAFAFPSTEEECANAALGFERISFEEAITNCVGAIDGYLMPIRTPSKQEVGNVHQYFSGHYSRHGLNVQAICDAQCRLTYLSASSPGSANDRVAYKNSKIGDFIDKLPLDYVVLADAAYDPSEHCLPMYFGMSRHDTKYDSYNYYASQLRIRIEMCFGMMTRKFEILDCPLKTKLSKAILILHTIGRLHNYCINERLAADATAIQRETATYNHQENMFRPTVEIDNDGDPVAQDNDQGMYRVNGGSINRELMADKIFNRGLRRHENSIMHVNNRAQQQ